MKQFIRVITSALYKHAVKPLLFRRSPDDVHRSLIRLTKTIQRLPLVRSLPKLWSHNDQILEQTIAGTDFRNPVGLSAGFDKEVSMSMMMKAVGFGWMMGGSVTWGQYDGNEGDWFYRLPKTGSLVVNAGLPSEGTSVVSKRIADHNSSLFDTFQLGVSVAKTNTKANVSESDAVKDYCASLSEFDKLDQVRFLEVNISCPNTFGGEPFTTCERLDKLLVEIDLLSLKKPVFIKMPINLPLNVFDELLDVIVTHDVVGVTIGNLHKDRQTVKLLDELPDNVKGNLSGAPTRAITTELIEHTYRRHGKKLIIIGVGGIMNADDAYEKICAGASLVGLITGLIFEGPSLPGQINHDLAKKLRSDGYTSISHAVGSKT